MKNYFFRSTAIFILILSLGVGTAWANTTHPVYCAIRPSSLGETGELYLNVHKGTTSDGGVWYRVKMKKIATTIHKAATGETKDLYVASIEYAEVGLQQMEFQIYDAAPPASPRETHMAFDKWTTNSDTWTKQVFDYENRNFTTYPASLPQKKSYVYFDAADWNDNVKQLVISHGTFRGFNDLNHLSNTTLYYTYPDLNWGDAVCISFIGNSTSWSEAWGKWLDDIPNWSKHYTGYLHYSLQENSFNYFARRSGDKNGAALSYNYWGTESTAYQNLNKTQTVQARVKTTGSSYSDVSFASWPGSVSAKRTYMSSATATTSPSAANMTSATTDAVLTSSITLTASANSGYYFEGWGDASDSNPTDGTTAKTYSVTDTKTSYAFFSQTYTLTYDRKGDYSTSTLSVYSVDNFSGTTTSGSSIPTGHLITLVATPATGYEVEGWFSDAACTSPYTNGSGGVTIEGNTFKLASLNANTEVYCKFRPITYTVTLEGMEATPADPIKIDVTYNKELSSPVSRHTKEHYEFQGYWTDNNDKGATLVQQLIDKDGNWRKGISTYTGTNGDKATWIYPNNKSLFAKWEEIKYTVDVAVSPAEAGSVQVNGQTVSSVSNVGYATHSPELTAVPSNAAWVFKEWREDEKLELDLEHYTREGETMEIFATGADQKLTAVFEKRYNLVGSKYELDKHKPEMATGGMPGWTFGSGADFTINSYTPNGDNATVNMSCTRNLKAGDFYYIFEIHDREKGVSLGRNNGPNIEDIYVLNDGGSVELQGGEHQDRSIFFKPLHEGQYTFRITYMRKDGDFYYPTVTVERPHQLHMGHVHAEIDNTSATNSGDTGGTLSATIGGSPIYNDGLYNYGADITYTALPATGYTIKWYTDNTYSSEFSEQPANSWTHSNVTDDENVYVRFTEIPTAVTLSNDGHGHVEIDGMTVSSTTVGVTTHRELTAVPDEGYKLNSWIVSGDDIALSSKSTNPTTLSGLGAGAVSGQEVRANFVERWALSAESEGWGHEEFSIANVSIVAEKAIGYVDIELPANKNMQFKMVDKQTGEDYKSGTDKVYSMTNGNSYKWSFDTDKAYNCGITTAGEGTYRFIWNITDKTMSVIYPNFVIYRTGDQGEDSESATHTITTPVESYNRGTIEQAIEFRMKVRELDKWYSLSLPFEVNKVCVWDAEDGAYYDIVPYYRPTPGGTFYTGHYIIRKPVTTTNFAIEGFEGRDRWIDPESSNVLPSKNIPYIIQWHDSYFLNKYISFFGDTNQDIPSYFNAGAAPSENDVVNIFGNNTMHNGTVRDAYLLDKDYGPSGAWLREDIGRDRTILPFECFILANTATTTRYRILRRGMEETDTPTALEQISNYQSPMAIRVYTITGVLIGEYNDCSFQDAAHRIATDYNEGIYILRSENESMKLLLGGK